MSVDHLQEIAERPEPPWHSRYGEPAVEAILIELAKRVLALEAEVRALREDH